jgi:hypothetical protein
MMVQQILVVEVDLAVDQELLMIQGEWWLRNSLSKQQSVEACASGVWSMQTVYCEVSNE